MSFKETFSGEFLRGTVTGASLLLAGVLATAAEFPPIIEGASSFVAVELPHAADLTPEARRRIEVALHGTAEAFALVERDHVSVELEDEIVARMLDGALGALDAHSGFMDADSAARMIETPEETTNRIIGVRAMEIGGAYIIESVSPGSPAEQADLRPGDQVVRIGSLSVADESPMRINEMIQSRIEVLEGDRPLELGIRRRGVSHELSRHVVPERIVLSGVDELGVRNGILHLHVRSFYEGMAEDVRVEIAEGIAEGKVSGVLIDLRNNTGGLTSEALALAELFLPRDLLLYEMTGRHIGVRTVSTTARPAFANLPVAIVVNGATASASEIFAAAMQAHGRASIIGWTTLGKGTVQRIYPTDNGAIKITVAEYRDGGLRPIEGRGVMPDVLVPGDDPVSRPSRFVPDPAREAAMEVLTDGQG